MFDPAIRPLEIVQHEQESNKEIREIIAADAVFDKVELLN